MTYLQIRRKLGRLVHCEAIYKRGCFALSRPGASLHRGRIEMIYFDDPKKPQYLVFACTLYGRFDFATRTIVDAERDFHYELKMTEIEKIEKFRSDVGGCVSSRIIRISSSVCHVTLYPFGCVPLNFIEPAMLELTKV